jgi:hypothetical protein
MTDTSTATKTAPCFFGLIFIALLTLKLAEAGSVATLSWWWVIAPLFAPLVVTFLGVFIAGIVGVFK